jgi:gliding motility-associated-like protein
MYRYLFLFIFFLLFSLCSRAQVILGFQGAEPGDNWGYSSTGADLTAQIEAYYPSNFTTGSASLVVGGNTSGGSCIDGGSNNGPSVARTFTFNNLNISSSNAFQMLLSFNWGNRFPVCVGTGYDSGENLVFTPFLDGLAQAPITLAVGASNKTLSIHDNQFNYSIPACVNSFHFTLSVTTNRRDELLFLDDVALTAPAYNSNILAGINGNLSACAGTVENYNVTGYPGIVYFWSGLPAGASFVLPNGTSSASQMSIDWGTAMPGIYTLSVVASDACGNTYGPQSVSIAIHTTPVLPVITGPDKICPGSSIVLNSNYTSGNTWQTGETTASISVSTQGTYILTVSTACGSLSTSHIVNASPAPDAVVSPSGSQFICNGGAVSLHASGGDSYIWSTGASGNALLATTAGTYFVTAQNYCGTSVSAPVTVSVISPPLAQIFPPSGFKVCNGQSFTLNASGGDTFLWQTGETSSTVSFNVPGTYSVTVSNACGSSSVFVNVLEEPAPKAIITNHGSNILCKGGEASLSASGTGAFLWSTGQSNKEITVSAGNYYLVASTTCGTDTAFLELKPSLVKADFYPSQTVGPAPLEIYFSNNSLNANSYQWFFGDGGNTYLESPSHTYTKEGSYAVMLVAANKDNCRDTVFNHIIVEPEVYVKLFIPNVFSPNGDLTNDIFKVEGSGIVSLTGSIFNRWGQKVFEWVGQGTGWDGNIGGVPAMEDTYFYKVEIDWRNGKKESKAGHFTLFR